MRIDLKVPYPEKDSAKALGAPWDAAKKIWHIKDVADIAPFLRWIPDVKAATEGAAGGTTRQPTDAGKSCWVWAGVGCVDCVRCFGKFSC